MPAAIRRAVPLNEEQATLFGVARAHWCFIASLRTSDSDGYPANTSRTVTFHPRELRQLRNKSEYDPLLLDPAT